jgi:hypothetical protein
MLESEAAQGDGVAVGSEGEMIAAAAGGKWESRGLGGISKRRGKPVVVVGFPRSGVSLGKEVPRLEKSFNLARLNSHKDHQSPWQIIERITPRSPLELCLLPPVFLDYYLNDAGGYDVPRLPYLLLLPSVSAA